MIEREEFRASHQDTVVVVYPGTDYDTAVVTTRLTIDGAPGVREIVEKVRVAPDNRIYKLTLDMPEPELKGRWLLTVLLPPGTEPFENDGELTYREAANADFDRPVLTRGDNQDPPIPINWRYILGR